MMVIHNKQVIIIKNPNKKKKNILINVKYNNYQLKYINYCISFIYEDILNLIKKSFRFMKTKQVLS